MMIVKNDDYDNDENEDEGDILNASSIKYGGISR